MKKNKKFILVVEANKVLNNGIYSGSPMKFALNVPSYLWAPTSE